MPSKYDDLTLEEIIVKAISQYETYLTGIRFAKGKREKLLTTFEKNAHRRSRQGGLSFPLAGTSGCSYPLKCRILASTSERERLLLLEKKL